jgi:hypothetical protein
MRNLLPESEPLSLMVFRLDDRRHASRPAAAEGLKPAMEIQDTLLSTDELAAPEEALESQRNS